MFLLIPKKKLLKQKNWVQYAICNSVERGAGSMPGLRRNNYKNIFTDFHKLGDVNFQRELLDRFCRQRTKQANTTTLTESRRQKTNIYYLPLEGGMVKVCQKLFSNTLGITEKVMRTALEKRYWCCTKGSSRWTL